MNCLALSWFPNLALNYSCQLSGFFVNFCFKIGREKVVRKTGFFVIVLVEHYKLFMVVMYIIRASKRLFPLSKHI